MVEPIYYLVDGVLTLQKELKLLITSPFSSIDPGIIKNSAWIMMPTGSRVGRKYRNHIFHISLLTQQHCPSHLFHPWLVLVKLKINKTLKVQIIFYSCLLIVASCFLFYNTINKELSFMFEVTGGLAVTALFQSYSKLFLCIPCSQDVQLSTLVSLTIKCTWQILNRNGRFNDWLNQVIYFINKN